MSGAVAAAPGQGREWTRGQVGTLCLIMAESTFFAVLLVAYLFYIGKSISGPQPSEVLTRPWLASVLLLSSSGTIVWAVRDLERGRTSAFLSWLFATILLGVAFLGFTAFEWYELIVHHDFTIATNLFGTTYFTLVGFHAAHVTIGLVLMLLILVLGALGHVWSGHAERVELLSWYWHFVDVVWIAVFTVVYVVGY